jgi:GTP 3',8-cyclase
MKPLNDIYGRQFKTLRVSLLNRCNLSCVYCTMGEDVAKPEKEEPTALTASELLTIITNLHTLLSFSTIRLTGGEPLLYHDLIPIIEGLNKNGLHNIKLTTNGFLLERMAVDLVTAGLKSINVSLDAIDENMFALMSKRGNIQRILNGIDAAIDAGLHVKLNAVIMKGINESQVLPLLQFAFDRNISIRFLEVMSMGHLHQQPKKYLVTQQELLHIIAQQYQFEPCHRQHAATANYWQTTKGHQFGIIANESAPFCGDCDRLRLDSKGQIYGCLSSNHPIPIANVQQPEQLQACLQEAMQQKQTLQFTGSNLSMLDIGG